MDNTFPVKNTVNIVLILLRLCRAFSGHGEPDNFIGMTGTPVPDHSCLPRIHLHLSLVMTLLKKAGSLVAVWIKSLASEKRCFFCSYCRSHGTNFATTCFMARSCIEIWHSSFGVPRSASSSRTVSNQSLLIAAHTRSTFSGVLLVSGLPEHGSLSTDSWPSLKYSCHT